MPFVKLALATLELSPLSHLVDISFVLTTISWIAMKFGTNFDCMTFHIAPSAGFHFHSVKYLKFEVLVRFGSPDFFFPSS